MTVSRPLVVALVDLEPALAASLLKLLRPYREFEAMAWRGDETPSTSVAPDILLVTPQRPDRLTELRRRYPTTYILGRVPWDKDGYWNHPDLDERLDKLASFETVLDTLRRIRRERFPTRLQSSG